MIVYAVFRQGVARQECGGIFKPLVDAINAADMLADEDCDNYHTYEVVPYPLGVRALVGGYDSKVLRHYESPEIEEALPVYKTRKGDTAAERLKARMEALNGRA